MSNGYASFGLYSTVEDLYLLDRALYTEELLTEGSIRDVFTRYFDFGATGGVTYGWSSHRVYRHDALSSDGGTGGFKGVLTRLPDDDIAIIVLSNSATSPVTKIIFDVASILFGLSYRIPQEPEAIELDPDTLDDYTGEFENQFSFFGGSPPISVTREEEALYMDIEGLGVPRFRIFPENRTSGPKSLK